MLRLYIDEDSMRHGLGVALRNSGFDCLTAEEAGQRAKGDEDQLAFAARESRAVYTRNVRDFRVLHDRWLHTGRTHAGIILLTEVRLGIGEQVRAFEQLAENLGQSGLVDQIAYLLNYR